MDMKRCVKYLRIFTVVFLVCFHGGEASQAQESDERYKRVDTLFVDWERTASPGCALAIVQDGKIIYKQGYGMANLDHDIPIKPNTVFRIGSISKQFTASSILILNERGKLSLDDNIRKYLPEMPEYKWPITIRHLIHHTSGIRDYESLQYLSGEHDDQGEHHNDDIMELVACQKVLNFKPGDQYLYSNSGYTLLAVIVERVCGRSIGQFVKDNIFIPLGMQSTFIYENNRAVVKNRATGYGRVDGHFFVDETLNESTGDGGVFTTVEDFYLWDQNFYDNKIDCPDFIKKIKQIGKLNNGANAGNQSAGRESGYAFGLSLSAYRGLRTLGHGGAYVGFRARFMQFPDHYFSIICLANLSTINPTELCHKIADIFLDKYFTEPPKGVRQLKTEKQQGRGYNPSLKQLADYAGDYYSDELMVTYVLRNDKGGLIFAQKNPPIIKPLQAVSEDIFTFEDYSLKFQRDPGGKICGFHIDADRSKNIFFKKICY